MSDLDSRVKHTAFLVAFGAAIVWGLVEYVDAQIAKAPWTRDKPFVMRIMNEGFQRIDKRLDKMDEKIDKLLERSR